jgi:phosphoribosylformylglycinamidine cyclo-ligase
VKDAGVDYETPAPFETGKNMGDVLLAPTRIYVKPMLKALKAGGVKGMAHITGGGLSENIPRVLPANACVQLDAKDWPRPAIFGWLAQAGKIEAPDMARTFNCGLGMVVIVEASKADGIVALLKDNGETAYKIGKVSARQGTDGPQVVIDNETSLLG